MEVLISYLNCWYYLTIEIIGNLYLAGLLVQVVAVQVEGEIRGLIADDGVNLFVIELETVGWTQLFQVIHELGYVTLNPLREAVVTDDDRSISYLV